MTNAEFWKIEKRLYKFNTLVHAESFRDRATKAMNIVLGCDGMYWVATLGVCEVLVRNGYEFAN